MITGKLILKSGYMVQQEGGAEIPLAFPGANGPALAGKAGTLVGQQVNAYGVMVNGFFEVDDLKVHAPPQATEKA